MRQGPTPIHRLQRPLVSLRWKCWLLVPRVWLSLPPQPAYSQEPSSPGNFGSLFLPSLPCGVGPSLQLNCGAYKIPQRIVTCCPVPALEAAPRASNIAKFCVYWSVTLKSIVSEPKKHTHSAPHNTTESLRQAHSCPRTHGQKRWAMGQAGPPNRLCSAQDRSGLGRLCWMRKGCCTLFHVSQIQEVFRP